MRKTRITAFVLLLCMIISVVAVSLVSCGEVHKHTYSSDWSYDETSHWHAATCAHTTLTADKADHTFGDDGKCTVCGYERKDNPPAPHEHTYSDAWSADDTHHWHAATCEHTNEKKDFGAHDIEWTTVTPATCTDAGTKTGVCKVCHKTFEGTIPKIDHTYSQTYRFDMENHWKVCTSCGGETTHEAHTFGDDGRCTVCGKSRTETPPDYFTALPVKKDETAL